MDAETAAKATEAPVDATRKALGNSTFSGGYIELWDRGRQYVADVLFTFDHPVDADRFRQFELGYLSTSPAASTYTYPLIPNATGFALNGVSRAHPYLFCQGTWFTLGAEVFNIYHCDPDMPVDPSLVDAVSAAQYRRAAVTPSPG